MTDEQKKRFNRWISEKRGYFSCNGYCRYSWSEGASHDLECAADWTGNWAFTGPLMEELVQLVGAHIAGVAVAAEGGARNVKEAVALAWASAKYPGYEI